MEKKLKVVDLFSGAGGLSLGFMQTGCFDIKVAFENNPSMQETYCRNHPNVDMRGDVCVADYTEIQAKHGSIDVVIGGPPCQGFSNANRQKNHVISHNNMLVKQYIRAINELKPKAFVMENVSMLRSDVHRFYLDEADEPLLCRYDIHTSPSRIVLLEKDCFFEDAIEIVKDKDRINAALWPEEHYAALNVIYKATRNQTKVIGALSKHRKKLLKYAGEYIEECSDDYIVKQSKKAFTAVRDYYEGNYPLADLKEAIEPAVMIQRMLSKAKEIYDNKLVVDEFECKDGLAAVIRSYAVYDYIKAILGSKPNDYVINAGVLCAADFGAPQKRNRFIVYGIKKSLSKEVKLPQGTFSENTYRTVRDAIVDLESIPTVTKLADDTGTPVPEIKEISDLGRQLRDTRILFNHMVTNTGNTAMERFKMLKQGENFHSLDNSLKTNTYTDISRTQNTIYLRLDYDQPSGTVINVRKSMWVHPVLNRAVSVREAARLQTFPDSFVFCGTKDKQYQQVGNAVPPIMARAIAENMINQLCKKEQ